MEKIISFIVENWRIIADVCAAVLALVLFICRKKPIKVIDGVLGTLLELLPVVISRVEEDLGPGNGKEKKKMVLDVVKETALKLYPELNWDFYWSHINVAIENILSTPQKKGD